MIQGCSVNSALGRWVLLATLLASGTSFLMGTAVIVALPVIQSSLNASINDLQWVINAQLLSLASLLMIGGSLGDCYGRKRIFITGMSLFASGAILSALSSSINLLVTFQALQGAGAALMIPQSLAIINACFDENQRGQAIGLWAGLSGGVASLGPWVGGWLVENFSWQAIFFLPVPIIVLTIIITAIYVPESRNASIRHLDWRGTILIILGLFGIAYGLISGPAAGWNNPFVISGLTGGSIAVFLFVFTEKRQPQPLVPASLLKNRLVLGANAVTLLIYFALNGVFFFLVLNLQQVQELSPTIAGFALLPLIVIITFLAGPAGALADRIGTRFQMIIGPIILAIGMATLAIGGSEANYFRHFLPGLILIGVGMALLIAPLTKLALSVEAQFSGSASGFNNAVSRMAALLAVAVLGAVVISAFTAHLNDTISASSLAPEEQAQILAQSNNLGNIIIPGTFDESSRQLAERAVKESFIYGFRWAMLVGAGLALAGALVSIVTLRGSPPGGRSVSVGTVHGICGGVADKNPQ